MLSVALAQSPTPPGANAPTPPAATQAAPKADTPPAPKADAMKPAGATDSAQFVTTQSPDQWLASKFKGTNVLGPDDTKVGDVSDILFTRDGKIHAYVISVGGFLGIGSKDVALAPDSFQVQPGQDPTDFRLKIAMSKEQLKDAAAFEPFKAPPRVPTTGMTPRTDRLPAPTHPGGPTQ